MKAKKGKKGKKGKKAGMSPMAAATRTTAGDPWFKCWEGKSILFQRVFDTGGDNFRNKLRKPGSFRLESRVSQAGELIQFSINFDDENVHPVLKGQILTPRGKHVLPFTGNPFSEWKEDQAHEDEYNEGLLSLVTEMHKEDFPFQRLETTVPFPVGDKLLVDRMRIVLLPKAVKLGSGDRHDLAVVVLTLVEANDLTGMQNGGGSGPPDP